MHRLFFFINNDYAWNFFDFLLVFTGCFDVIMSVSFDGSMGVNLTFARAVRILRLVRVLRGFRALRFFHEMRVMMSCMLGAISIMFWSICMMTFMFYFFGMILVQGIAGHLAEHQESMDQEVVANAMRHWGSVEQGMLTWYIITLGGDDWGGYFKDMYPIHNKVIFVAMVFCIQVNILNIITGIFVEAAMKQAEPDREAKAVALRMEEYENEEDLRRICQEVGISKPIDREELVEHFQNSRLRAYMSMFGISLQDPVMLYDKLHDGGEEPLTIREFVHGCVRLAGSASNLDMQILTERVNYLAHQYERSLSPSGQRETCTDSA